MQYLSNLQRVFALVFFVLMTAHSVATAEETDRTRFIANADISSKAVINGQSYPLRGRLSLNFSANTKEFSNGILRIDGANALLIDFPQSALLKPELTQRSTGALGFALSAGTTQWMKYDANRQALILEAKGGLTVPEMRAFATPNEDDKADSFVAPLQSGVLRVEILLDQPLKPEYGQYDLTKAAGKISASIKVEADSRFNLPSYTIDYSLSPVVLEFTALYAYKAVSELCLQPVRFSRLKAVYSWPAGLSFVTDYTGEGLNFGLPQAHSQWAKANIKFKVRSWKTFSAPDFFTVDGGGGFLTAEEQDVIDTVDDSDCVEVFFVDTFSPESAHGGGATVMSGTSSAQVITSDRNWFYGIDFTHLAHELGHVLNLAHPGAASSLAASSTGTLMCPSGFKNDNPKINSEQNKTNASNPLLVFKFAFIQDKTTDCTNSADCGACP